MKLKLLSLIALIGATLLSPGRADQPNFVVIFCDDLGYGDLRAFGNPTIKTPHLDRMAEEGQKWTQFYSADPICTPSRAGLLTGRYPIRNGMTSPKRGVLFPDSSLGLPAVEVTIAEVLKQRDYATAAVGKWHLGHLPQYLPTAQGFDSYYGIPYSNDMARIKDAPNYRQQTDDPDYYADTNDFDVPLMENDRVIEQPANQNTITRRYTERAVEFIEAHQKQPFFLYLAHSLPHIPLFVSTDFRGQSRRGLYGDVIEEIDWSVSQIISALEQLSIKDNTYIVFTSDNGPWLTYGSHAGSAKPLKDGKGTTFEGGMRVMTFFSGPGIMPGLNNDLGMQTDLLSTFITLARFIESYPSPDSFDLSDSLKQRKPSPRNFVPFYKGSELRAFRLRDHKIQYVTQGAYGQPPERQVHESPLLIDLINDVGESTNLADKNTELVTQIDTIAREFKASVDVKPSILDGQRRD